MLLAELALSMAKDVIPCPLTTAYVRVMATILVVTIVLAPMVKSVMGEVRGEQQLN